MNQFAFFTLLFALLLFFYANFNICTLRIEEEEFADLIIRTQDPFGRNVKVQASFLDLKIDKKVFESVENLISNRKLVERSLNTQVASKEPFQYLAPQQ